MFLSGSYHDRDNPQQRKASHGKPIVWMTIVCSRKEGRQQSSSRKGLRSSGNDDADDEDDDDDAEYFLRRNWYKMYRESKLVTRKQDRTPNAGDGGRQHKNNDNDSHNNNNTNTTNATPTGKKTPGARCDTVRRRVHRLKKKDERRKDADDDDMDEDESNRGTRMMNDGSATLRETRSDGHGDDLHQGRMEDDEDGGTPMMSTPSTLDRKTGQDTTMRQSAIGTLDRKTDQAPPTTCFLPSTLTNETRPTTPDKKCRGHEEEAKDGGRTAMMRTAARRGNYWMTTDKWTPWYCNQGEA
jgi:hypothetical protein